MCAVVLDCSHLLLIVAIGIVHATLATQCKARPTMLYIRLVIAKEDKTVLNFITFDVRLPMPATLLKTSIAITYTRLEPLYSTVHEDPAISLPPLQIS